MLAPLALTAFVATQLKSLLMLTCDNASPMSGTVMPMVLANFLIFLKNPAKWDAKFSPSTSERPPPPLPPFFRRRAGNDTASVETSGLLTSNSKFQLLSRVFVIRIDSFSTRTLTPSLPSSSSQRCTSGGQTSSCNWRTTSRRLVRSSARFRFAASLSLECPTLSIASPISRPRFCMRGSPIAFMDRSTAACCTLLSWTVSKALLASGCCTARSLSMASNLFATWSRTRGLSSGSRPSFAMAITLSVATSICASLTKSWRADMVASACGLACGLATAAPSAVAGADLELAMPAAVQTAMATKLPTAATIPMLKPCPRKRETGRSSSEPEEEEFCLAAAPEFSMNGFASSGLEGSRSSSVASSPSSFIWRDCGKSRAPCFMLRGHGRSRWEGGSTTRC
mmetsp:Transcript_53945/g.115859  ORF Transcript_53945/g.115859 Transcript_53945/m.115859 type:complete len:397 (+) Transcript_53945:246-1436(+)